MTVESEITICAKCRFPINKEQDPKRREIWYNWFCSKNPLPRSINPLTGKINSFRSNDLGRMSFTDDEYSYCSDINDGSCKDFKPAGKLEEEEVQ